MDEESLPEALSYTLVLESVDRSFAKFYRETEDLYKVVDMLIPRSEWEKLGVPTKILVNVYKLP